MNRQGRRTGGGGGGGDLGVDGGLTLHLEADVQDGRRNRAMLRGVGRRQRSRRRERVRALLALVVLGIASARCWMLAVDVVAEKEV